MAWQEFRHGMVLALSGDIWVCCFYVYRLPEVWDPYCVFSEPIRASTRWGPGEWRGSPVWLTAAVMPMGWISALMLRPLSSWRQARPQQGASQGS